MSIFDQMRAKALAIQSQVIAVNVPDFSTITAATFSVFDNGELPAPGEKYRWSKRRFAITMQLFEQTEPFRPTKSSASIQCTVQMSTPLGFMMYVEDRLMNAMPKESYEFMRMLADDSENKPDALIGLVFDKKSGTHYHWDHLLRFLPDEDGYSLECLFRGEMRVIDNFVPVNKMNPSDPILFAKYDPNKLMISNGRRASK